MGKLACKDFNERTGVLYSFSLPKTVEAINKWMEQENILEGNVISIETLTSSSGTMGMSGTVTEGVRVWYRN